ncbi:acetyl-CoA carboxylase, carboxyltransferase subunit beta [Sphingorhabdus sp. 109]|jgi:acetyl-CoA carboxylase carboxyl transferase subunit beta|uniref:acetyl-CoA carboxylase, carboxyltransferase subunit beta n=1 Tax=Sphingorhabdus sp. 109 TaxID=2653173 RepID=UPI0012F35187|nr:acetyl-CoA carboxylase, carboxyltransferase subunit beta [Sphingorhabdus sp. 109]VWX56624.1 acetyl-CoA carboxylase, beta (carboxyltranferase) subunit [Sphingorhabdus sp. 109]
MSWLSNVRKKIASITKKETPDNLWHKCKKCEAMVFLKEYQDNMYICPKCDHHGRIGPMVRFAQIMDEDSWKLIPWAKVQEDPLKFKDQKKYTDRLKEARAKTGEQDALINVKGTIESIPCVVGVQDFSFMGGSMGLAVGQAFVDGAKRALKDQCPYIIFTAAGGARMQEGILSLMQMPKTTVAISMLREAGIPFIVVLTDPTTGGVTASYAMLGDVHISEPGAMIGFAGQRVIENTIREKLPEGFQTAEYLLEHGMVDMVVHRKELREKLAHVMGYLMAWKDAA